MERLARDYDVYIYSARVEDVDLERVVWRHVPALPGPHLISYCWWFLANHFWRWWDRTLGGLKPELTYTPGINCLDADVISVHIVFGEFYRRVRHTLNLGANPMSSWPRLLHRRAYYLLVMALKRLVYGRKSTILTVVSRKMARHLTRPGRGESQLPVIVHGIDAQKFSVEVRRKLRPSARRELGLCETDFCLAVVGNDWKNKGLPCLLEALGRLATGPLRLLVVGRDIVEPYSSALARLHLENRVTFLPLRSDVEMYYAAADLYVGPSLEDAFGMPPLEAMACGVPSIVSSQMGVSEIITNGVDGFILDNPQDSARLAELIDLLCSNGPLRQQMGEAAAKTAAQYTWDENARQLDQLFREVLRRKGLSPAVAAAEQSAR